MSPPAGARCFCIACAWHTGSSIPQIHHVIPIVLTAAVVLTIGLCLVSGAGNGIVVGSRPPCAVLCIALNGRPLAVHRFGTGFRIGSGIGHGVPVADDISAILIVAVFRKDFRRCVYRVCHAERLDIVVQRMEITVAHQSRSTGQRLFKAVADEGHPGIIVVSLIGVLIVRRIA